MIRFLKSVIGVFPIYIQVPLMFSLTGAMTSFVTSAAVESYNGFSSTTSSASFTRKAWDRAYNTGHEEAENFVDTYKSNFSDTVWHALKLNKNSFPDHYATMSGDFLGNLLFGGYAVSIGGPIGGGVGYGAGTAAGRLYNWGYEKLFSDLSTEPSRTKVAVRFHPLKNALT